MTDRAIELLEEQQRKTYRGRAANQEKQKAGRIA